MKSKICVEEKFINLFLLIKPSPSIDSGYGKKTPPVVIVTGPPDFSTLL